MRYLWLLATAGIWAAGGMIRSTIHEQLRSPEGLESWEMYENNASTSVSGEFRSSMAGYLWGKADEYLHGGVHLRPMTESEKHGGAREATSSDNLVSHHDETGVIPDPEHDTRGVWGDIERSVKPYFDVRGHKHRNVRETLPLYRFMTWSDPHFVPGYLTGAYVLYVSDKSRLDEVLGFLAEGVRNNPESIAMRAEHARYLFTHAHRNAGAEDELLVAVRLSAKPQPNETENDAIQNAYRWLVLLYRKEGRLAEAERWAALGAQKYPNDPVFTRTLKMEEPHSMVHIEQ